MKLQIEEKKPTREATHDVCHLLVEANKAKPLVVASIKDRVHKIEAECEHIQSLICEQEAKLQSAQIRSREFHLSFDDFLEKLEGMEDTSSQLQPLSAVYDTLLQQSKTSEVTYSQCL